MTGLDEASLIGVVVSVGEGAAVSTCGPGMGMVLLQLATKSKKNGPRSQKPDAFLIGENMFSV